MNDHPSHRRGFIKGIVAGIAGAFFALRGAEPVQAASARLPRATLLPSAPVVLREVITDFGVESQQFNYENYGRTIIEAYEWARRQRGARNADVMLVAVPWMIDGTSWTYTVEFSKSAGEWQVFVFLDEEHYPGTSLAQIKAWAEGSWS